MGSEPEMRTKEQNQELAEILMSAEESVEAVISQMNEKKTVCHECEVIRFEDFDDHQVAEGLRGALGRLQRARLSLKGGAR